MQPHLLHRRHPFYILYYLILAPSPADGTHFQSQAAATAAAVTAALTGSSNINKSSSSSSDESLWAPASIYLGLGLGLGLYILIDGPSVPHLQHQQASPLKNEQEMPHSKSASWSACTPPSLSCTLKLALLVHHSPPSRLPHRCVLSPPVWYPTLTLTLCVTSCVVSNPGSFTSLPPIASVAPYVGARKGSAPICGRVIMGAPATDCLSLSPGCRSRCVPLGAGSIWWLRRTAVDALEYSPDGCIAEALARSASVRLSSA